MTGNNRLTQFKSPTQAIKVGQETIMATAFSSIANHLPPRSQTETAPPMDNRVRCQTVLPLTQQHLHELTHTPLGKIRSKDGKVVQTLAGIYNPSAKTLTVTAIGTVLNGQLKRMVPLR
jgi:hypothetical protein